MDLIRITSSFKFGFPFTIKYVYHSVFLVSVFINIYYDICISARKLTLTRICGGEWRKLCHSK
jgi:hypothetical protein